MGIIGVLLAILKVIGIILLGILGLLLIIILLFLFVPFVYTIRVKYVDKQLEADGEISFLFRLLRARAIYKEELSYEAKAAFFTLISSKKADEDKEDGKERRKENKAADVKAEDTSLKTTEAITSTGITERKAAKAEKETRLNEITKICDQYRTTEGVRNQYVNKRFDYANFAYLSSYVDSPRSELEGQIKKQIEFIATCFGRDGVNLWREIFMYAGINRIAANPALYTAKNIIDKCMLPCLRDDVLKEDFELFCEIIPNWRSKLMQRLSNHQWNKYSQEQFEETCDSLVGNSFSHFVIKQLNTILA